MQKMDEYWLWFFACKKELRDKVLLFKSRMLLRNPNDPAKKISQNLISQIKSMEIFTRVQDMEESKLLEEDSVIENEAEKNLLELEHFRPLREKMH